MRDLRQEVGMPVVLIGIALVHVYDALDINKSQCNVFENKMFWYDTCRHTLRILK